MSLIILCFSLHVKAQVTTVVSHLEIDGKKIRKNYKVFFYSEDKPIEAVRTTRGFVVPKEMENNEYLDVLITFGKYKLNFSKVHVSKFRESWVIGVDRKPFLSENNVSEEETKEVKQVYYIKFSGMGLSTRYVVLGE